MSDGYKFTHYIMKIKIICRVRILWIIRTQVRINQRIRTHSFWVRILPGTKSPDTLGAPIERRKIPTKTTMAADELRAMKRDELGYFLRARGIPYSDRNKNDRLTLSKHAVGKNLPVIPTVQWRIQNSTWGGFLEARRAEWGGYGRGPLPLVGVRGASPEKILKK